MVNKYYCICRKSLFQSSMSFFIRSQYANKVHDCGTKDQLRAQQKLASKDIKYWNQSRSIAHYVVYMYTLCHTVVWLNFYYPVNIQCKYVVVCIYKKNSVWWRAALLSVVAIISSLSVHQMQLTHASVHKYVLAFTVYYC